MVNRVWIAVCLAVLLTCTSTLVLAAPVLCRKGVKLKVREDACKGQETVFDISQLGAVGPPGQPGTPGAPGAPGAPGLGLTSPLVVPAAAFSDDGVSASLYFFDANFGYVRGSLGGGCIKAPVVLPPGNTITAVRGFLLDDDISQSVGVDLQRIPNTGGTPSILATVSPALDSTDVQEIVDTTVANGVVSNDYTYYLATCLESSTTRVYSIHIEFTPPGS